MSSHSRASPMVMVLSQPQPQQVTARFSSFNQGSTLSTAISPPFSALLRIPSLIALSLSLITATSIPQFPRKSSFIFTFFSCCKSLTIKDLRSPPRPAGLQLSSKKHRRNKHQSDNQKESEHGLCGVNGQVYFEDCLVEPALRLHFILDTFEPFVQVF